MGTEIITMALEVPRSETEVRRFSSLSEIRFNARSFLEGFPTPTPSSRYSHQSLPEHTEREQRRRSSGFNAIRDMLGHGRHGSASVRSSTSHLPLTQPEDEAERHDSDEEDHLHNHSDLEDEELEELATRPAHQSIIYSPLSRPESWLIAPPTEPHPAYLQQQTRTPSISLPPLQEQHSGTRDLEAQTSTTGTPPRRRQKKRRKRYHGGAWIRRSTPGTRRDSAFPDTIEGRTKGTMVTGFCLVVLLSTYLGVALSQKNTKLEVHILLAITIFAALLFFARNLYRLTILLMRPRPSRPSLPTSTRHRSGRPHMRNRSTSGRARIPSVAGGPEGFDPNVPIQVHLAADEEIRAEHGDGSAGEALKVPPPAYGLWRSSVKANPAYLHWVRADSVRNLNGTGSASCSTTSLISTAVNAGSSTAGPSSIGMLSRTQAPEMIESRQHQLSRLSRISESGSGPRPPSYMTDDGIEILMQPTLRGPTVVMPADFEPGEVHPAHRNQGPHGEVAVRSMLDV